MSIKVNRSTNLRPGDEVIEGYKLEKVIGRGGYGEVWQAIAPGNLKKAVKVVFGNKDDVRAIRERRSLERIRGIRHPFLLSLERFEVADDRLIIVTELADGSLEDIYNRHRKTGSCGIPRDALLKNLSDTADGLDYLHAEFGLQHLDVKPGNLLMIGGHVKVGDFGLLKDLKDVDCSVVGGLTPIYAPPELFDGKPSSNSDQYSLAVLFQEMLTGTRPFAGRTIAQLATQHVHSTPNLEPLPARDRPIVARALEKDPSRRFESCSEFISALAGKLHFAPAAVVTDPQTMKSVPEKELPELNSKNKQGEAKSLVRTGPRLLVIGIGGTGAKCLSDLRYRVGSTSNWCGVTMASVMIDTDVESLHAVKVGDLSSQVSNCYTVHAKLKSASDYRETASSRFSSVSRRWIYNVPKSGKTERIRPVGRLAMVDHGKEISAAIRKAIKEIAASGNAENLHVHVVGSIAGGTGSGMYIDVVHQIRHLLDEANLQEADIVSFLSMPAIRGAGSTDTLSTHNSQATLREISHFLKPGNGYPGDDGAGFASVPAARTPLRDLYLVAEANHGNYRFDPVRHIVDYAWSSATGAGDVLEEARRSQNKSEGTTTVVPATTIRTLGIVSLGNRPSLEQQRLTPAIVKRLIECWLGNPAEARKQAESVANRIGRRIGLSSENVFRSVVRTLQYSEEPQATAKIQPARIRSARVDGSLDFIAGDLSNQLNREISIALGDRRFNVATLIEAMSIMIEQCSKLSDQWLATVSVEHEDIKSNASDIVELASRPIQQLIEECLFLTKRLECLAAVLAVSAVELKKKIPGTCPWKQLPQKVSQLQDELVGDIHKDTVNTQLVRPLNDLNSDLSPEKLVDELSSIALPKVIHFVHQHAKSFERSSELSSTYEASNASLVSATQTIQFSRISEPDQDLMSSTINRNESTSNAGNGNEPLTVEEALGQVRPELSEFGGYRRLILILGSPSERGTLEAKCRQLHDGKLSVAVVHGSRPLLIYEAQQIELKGILARLEVLGGDSQITDRLASRIDVKWN